MKRLVIIAVETYDGPDFMQVIAELRRRKVTGRIILTMADGGVRAVEFESKETVKKKVVDLRIAPALQSEARAV